MYTYTPSKRVTRLKKNAFIKKLHKKNIIIFIFNNEINEDFLMIKNIGFFVIHYKSSLYVC